MSNVVRRWTTSNQFVVATETKHEIQQSGIYHDLKIDQNYDDQTLHGKSPRIYEMLLGYIVLVMCEIW